MGCGTSLSTDRVAKDEKRNRIVQQLFTELQGDTDCDSIYRGEISVSLKYSEENQLVLTNLLGGHGLLSRDGRSNSCDPYVIIEIKYTEKQPQGNGAQTHSRMAPTSEKNDTLRLKSAGRRDIRSCSLQHSNDYVTSTRKQLTVGKYGQVSTSQYDLHAEHLSDDNSDTEETSEPVNKLLIKHEVSTTARSKTAWRTQNPEYNELFLFHAPKNRLALAYLAVTVMDRQLIREDLCIGNVTVPLGSLSITGIQSIPPQWFTIKKTRPGTDSSTEDTEVDHERQQKVIRSQEFREAMLAHNSLQSVVLSKGLQSTHKTKVYRLTSVKHQQHVRIVT